MELSHPNHLDYGVRSFLYDFCILPSDTGVSRGFLSTLERHVNKSGLQSMLSKACQAVSWMTHGQALHRPHLVHEAETVYCEVVGTLARAIVHPTQRSKLELRLTSKVLGIYEVTLPQLSASNDESIHAMGLGALLGIGLSPLRLLSGQLLTSTSRRSVDKSSNGAEPLFCMSTSNHLPVTLDDLILHLSMLWTRYQMAERQDDLRILMADCRALQARFTSWQDSQVPESRPIALANFEGPEDLNIPVGCWPGRVDTYESLYTAGIWNTARAAQLLLFALTVKLSADISNTSTCLSNMPEANSIIKDMMASIPYHLTHNLHDFVNGPETEIPEPGRTLGGLLIMHPLYVAAHIPFTSACAKDYLQRCLTWIAKNMGIAQADKLALSQGLDENLLQSACMIIWSCFLD
ncbi:hypothetical protein B0T10DRAFT_419423 [Thelonectria olida]|uniref:Uncharacterized protein n=1 Tax=Thelonectria olida TaxID=1576542 RepID=A0A9P8VRB7_9HYPO|nr:hypothetical protein B0T10DRAFT_419423 [Thelonectria olida]